MRKEMFFRMDRTRVVTSKSWDPTRVLPEKHRDLSRLNKGFADPTSKRPNKQIVYIQGV